MPEKTPMAAHEVPRTFQGKRHSPLDSIRAFCLWCCGGSAPEVRECPSSQCVLFPYRMASIPQGVGRSLVKVIKARCLDCLPGGPADCDALQPFTEHPPCPLWPFRMGENPNYGREQREKLRAHGKQTGFKPGSQPRTASRIAPERKTRLRATGGI